MKKRTLVRVFAAAVLALMIVGVVAAQAADYRISTPYTYKNLTIFLLHGKDQDTKGNVMTLQEAMERNLFRVYETGDCNELEVENLSKEVDVFIQSGAIVNDAQLARALAASIIT